jgi:hypothetical protein
VISQHERALAQIVDRQRRQGDAKPGGADGASAEMPEISIKCFRAGDRKKNGTERYQTNEPMACQKLYAVNRIEGIQHGKILRHMPQAGDGDRNKPDERDRAEERRHPARPS